MYHEFWTCSNIFKPLFTVLQRREYYNYFLGRMPLLWGRKKNMRFESAVISKVISRFRWYLWRVSGNITSFFGGKLFLEYSSFVEIFANYGFFQLWENLIFVTWREKMRFFGEKWLFSTNMLDSGQNSLKTPHITCRSLISAISADLSKVENWWFWSNFGWFLRGNSA